MDNLRVGFTPNPGLDCVPGAVVVDFDLDLEPETGTGPVGGSHEVTATLTTTEGDPVDEVDIEFTVSGAHSVTGTGSTDAAGVATFGYAGATSGLDTISACYRPDPEAACAATAAVSFTWTGDLGVERIWGPDRYGTAAEISAEWPSGAEVVYVATGQRFPDALSVSSLAGTLNAPVLLTRHTVLPAVTRAELERLQPARIVILGDQHAVSQSVETALADYAISDGPGAVSRLAGVDRYATSLAVALEFPTGVDRAYVATGHDFPDALAGGARGGVLEAPVVLTRPGALGAHTIAALQHLQPGEIIVLGGPDSVSDAVVDQLAAYTTGGVNRVFGDHRYATAAAVSADYAPGVGAVFVATGWEFADALTGGPLAASIPGPVLLTKPHVLPAATIAELERLEPQRIIILGDTPSVSTEVEIALAAYLVP